MMTAPLPDIAAPAAPPRFAVQLRQAPGLLFPCLEEQYWLACRPQVEGDRRGAALRRPPPAAQGARRRLQPGPGGLLPARLLGGLCSSPRTRRQPGPAALADQVPETEDLMEQEDDAPIIRLINAILGEAIRENASDIHLETFEKRLVVRFRVDGVLREVLEPKRDAGGPAGIR